MAEPEFQDLIIIKRRANTDPEMPKGGVWKIAFADFMTAMMCFFLVMWLINAANEDTRQAVASYFNPVRLAELNRKGLENPRVNPEDQPKTGEQTREPPKPGEAQPPVPGEAHPRAPDEAHQPEPAADASRDALSNDPYKVLSELAGKDAEEASSGQAGPTAAGPVSEAGREFRDPFDPFFAGSASPGSVSPADQTASAGESLRPTLPPPAEASATEEGEASLASTPPPSTSVPEHSIMTAGSVPMSRPADDPAGVSMVSWRPPHPTAPSEPTDSSELAAALSDAVKAEAGADHGPSVAVEDTGEGIMISLTDDADFGMFDIGSAEPQPQLVRIMQRIASILKARSGLITIRGHTDARPFRTASYDNWRLSTDRAQMAYYMLVRGGFDELRVEAIEGYADRKLKVPTDPEAAENRRIEILLREATL